MNDSVRQRIAVGAGWTISLRWIDRLIGLLSIAFLARLLLPEDFGLVAYAMVFLTILDEFLQFSFETVLIRDQTATSERYNTVWTLEIIKGLVASTIIAATAGAVANFFNEPDVEQVLYWVAVIPILKGLVNIGTVNFQKDLQFNKEFFFNVTVRLAATILTVVLAFLLRSYWALVYGAVAHAVFRLFVSYAICAYRPRLGLSEISRVMGFSVWLLAQNIFQSINLRFPVIVIGRLFDAQALAYFNMARELTNQMTLQFAAPIRRALYPGITKMQGDSAEMANTLTVVLGVIVLLGLPATIGIGVTAPLLVSLFLGSNWIEIAPLVTVLSLSAAIDIMYPSSHVVYYAMNRPDITARVSILRTVVLAPTILVVAPKHGVLGAAWALVAVNSLITFIDYFILFRVTDVTFADALASIWRSIVAVIVMAYCVTLTVGFPFSSMIQDSTILHFMLSIAVGFVSYVSTILLLWWYSGFREGPEAYIFRILKRTLYRRTTNT